MNLSPHIYTTGILAGPSKDPGGGTGLAQAEEVRGTSQRDPGSWAGRTGTLPSRQPGRRGEPGAAVCGSAGGTAIADPRSKAAWGPWEAPGEVLSLDS